MKVASKERQDKIFAITLLIPAFLIIVVFILVPILDSLIKSFTDYNLTHIASGKPLQWNHFRNYIEIFKGKELYDSIYVTFVFMFSVVILQFVFSMILSLIINSNIRFQRFFRSIIMLPWVIPTIITAILWMWLYQPQYGVINFFLVKLGIVDQPIGILSNPKLALWAIVIAALWKQVPLMTIMLIAGLQGIPEEMYEAAAIDGSTKKQTFWYVTLPFLKTVIKTTVLMSIIDNFKQFPLFWTMTGGGPMNKTQTLAIYSYKNAFVNMNFGKGAAIAMVWLVLLIGVSIVYNKVFETAEIE